MNTVQINQIIARLIRQDLTIEDCSEIRQLINLVDMPERQYLNFLELLRKKEMLIFEVTTDIEEVLDLQIEIQKMIYK